MAICAYCGYSPGQSGLHARVLGDECGDELPQRDGGGERLVGQPRAAERRGVVVEQPAEDLAPLVGLLRVRVTVRVRVRVSVRVRGRVRVRISLFKLTLTLTLTLCPRSLSPR